MQLFAVIVALHLIGLLLFVPARDVPSALRNARSNIRQVGPTAVLLGGVLIANSFIRNAGVDLAWLIGVNITRGIYAIEGTFVASVQSVATPALTAFFSFIYVFGYAFLLTFPIVIYALIEDGEPLLLTLVAYSLNYGLGLVSYVFFIAYGPRNYMPELVESILFTNWPQVQLLTGLVNVNTNVFPSLHASLAVTVALLAIRFREIHWHWTAVATGLAVLICISTMYLGIHWLTDVVGGILLAVLSVSVASRLVTKSLGTGSVIRLPDVGL